MTIPAKLPEGVARLRFAPGSSREKVVDALRNFNCGCMVVVGFDVWVHHSDYHETLRKAIGETWDDSESDGSFSVVGHDVDSNGNRILGDYIAVRFKYRKAEPYTLKWAEELIRNEFSDAVFKSSLHSDSISSRISLESPIREPETP